jgi:hypothetical protein
VFGVVNDLVTQLPFDPVEPAIYFTDGWKGIFTDRLHPGLPITDAIERIRTVFRKFDPQRPYYYSFVDEEYGKNLQQKNKSAHWQLFLQLLPSSLVA